MLANLYPDIVELGGLSNAAREAIAERGLLVSVGSDSGSAWTARVEADRGICYLNVGARERVFFFEIHRRNYRIVWASGASPDFDVVISVVCQWLHGRRAFEIAEEFSFVRVGPLADIDGDLNLTAAQWASLLEDESNLNERPMLESAFGDRRARASIRL